MTSAAEAGEQPQSAAAPSPFPPIADFAFLSNCHTGALVAPDGGDRLAVRPALRLAEHLQHAPGPPGRLLPVRPVRRVNAGRAPVRGGDEHAGHHLAGPRRLDGRPRRAHARAAAGEDTITPHTRPPFDDDADHLLVRTVECIEGGVDIDLVCEPVFDYGRVPADWTMPGDDRHVADATGAGLTIRLTTDLLLGIEGDRVRAPARLEQGERAFCSLSWAEGLASPADVDEATERLDATTRFWRSWVGRARIPDHRWREPIQRSALAIKGLTYMPTGATVAALTTSLPETPGRRAQLGLPLHVDPRRDVHAAGAALARTWTGRPTSSCSSSPTSSPTPTASLQIMYGIDGRRDLTGVDDRRAVRLRRRAAGAGRQRRVRPAPERRLRRGARLDPAPHAPQRAAAAAAVADRAGAGRGRHRASGASPTRGSGRRAASRSTTSPRS